MNDDTDCAIIATKDNFGRSQHGALYQDVKTQHYGKQLGKVSEYSCK